MTRYICNLVAYDKGSHESNAANSAHWCSSSCMIQEVRQPSLFSARARKRNEPCCSSKFRRQYPTRRQLADRTPNNIRYWHRCNKWHAIKYAFCTLSLDNDSPITMMRCFAIVFWFSRSALGLCAKVKHFSSRTSFVRTEQAIAWLLIQPEGMSDNVRKIHAEW